MEEINAGASWLTNVELILRIGFQLLLLSASAFFSGSEAGLFSMSRLDLQKLRTTRHPMSEKLHELLDEPRRLIISLLCGNELVNIASSANMAAILLMFFTEQETQWVNILVMVPVLLLVGEVTPKTIAVTFPEMFTTKISAPLMPQWIQLITPLRNAVRLVADRVTTWIVGEAVGKENILQLDEFRTLVEEGEATGIIDATERILIDNMLKASQTGVYHIMTPRTRMKFLEEDMPLPEMIAAFRRIRHPRVPVILNHPDNIVGFLHSEDVLRLQRHQVDLSKLQVRKILRPAHFVPPTKKVDEMFAYFQQNNTRVAVVVGEYGGVHGVITMKDVLTFIFGEISGSTRASETFSHEEGGYVVPGDMRLEKFHDVTGWDIDDPLMSTIGGVVFRLFDRLPQEGESIVMDSLRFTVVEMDRLRIETLRVEQTTNGGEEPVSREEEARSGAVDVTEAYERQDEAIREAAAEEAAAEAGTEPEHPQEATEAPVESPPALELSPEEQEASAAAEAILRGDELPTTPPTEEPAGPTEEEPQAPQPLSAPPQPPPVSPEPGAVAEPPPHLAASPEPEASYLAPKRRRRVTARKSAPTPTTSGQQEE